MPSIAQMLGSIAENMVQKLNKINASLAKQGQSAANTFDDVSRKIEAIKSGADVSGVTASETDVLVTKIFVNSSGIEKEGIMLNNGAVRQTLSVSQPNYDIPKGYHNGLGYVKIQTQEKTVTPQSYEQTIEPDQDKVLSKVNVGAVNLQYKNISPMPYGQYIQADSKYSGLSSVYVGGAALYEEHDITPTSNKSITFSLSRNDTLPDKIIIYPNFNLSAEKSTDVALLELHLYRYRVDYVQAFWVRYRDADNYLRYNATDYESYTETFEALGITLTKNGFQYTVTISPSSNLTFNTRNSLTAHVSWYNEDWK